MSDPCNYVDPLKNSILTMFLGQCLGKGSSREVYELVHDASLVMKVETSSRTFHNQTEWLVWQEMKEWPISDWFAPCTDIDPYGNVLIQKRTEPFDTDRKFKAALTRTRGGVIPSVLHDIHFANFGMLDGQVVCHDYGYHGFFEQIGRNMSIHAGYITYDDPYDEEKHDFTDGGQLVLDI
jgi:hypothetical protein